MTINAPLTTSKSNRLSESGLAARLSKEFQGDILFDKFSRGRYSTDASIYQVEPIGVVIPKSEEDIIRAVEIAVDEGIPILPRGSGTSQCGQTVGEALVIDCSKYLNKLIEIDVDAQRATVQPGVVLDHLNAALKPKGLFFPVDVSTSSRATIGGMTANNSCGARSIRYGNMVHNVHAIDAILADGAQIRFGETPPNLDGFKGSNRYIDLVQGMRNIGARDADEIDARIPKLLRKVGGYNIETISPAGHNMAHLLVGSEGTLGFFKKVELNLAKIPTYKVLGVCHFPTFYSAMEITQHAVKLDPSAVELVDRTMIDLSRDIPMFRAAVDKFVMGEPEALLLVEFSGEDRDDCLRRLKQLGELLADHGYPGAVLEAISSAFQTEIWEVRKQGLNIMMSMKGDGKPVSFIEDCAVPLKDLAEFTDRLTQVFHKHGTSGTWYAHASVGTLHVRPILDMRKSGDVKSMRAIAEEAFAMVREYKGSHSGEHGDGLVRSEFHEPMFGKRIVSTFAEVKDCFDPTGLFNPGKIVRPPKMDDRSLFRYKPDYAPKVPETALDWSEWGGFDKAIEMCNNNGACRKSDAAVMCPSYRATGEEKDLTRGRANTLRLALSGQLGPDALTSNEMAATMELCVGCKGCKRECPTGVDMARMKTEFLYQYNKKHNLPLREKLIAYLPRYASTASFFRALMNLRDQLPGLATLSEWALGFSANRTLPKWRAPYRANTTPSDGRVGEVVLLADTFNTNFEPENLHAARHVLEAAGYKVHHIQAAPDGRALCCGRTFLAAGLVNEAKTEALRTLAVLNPFVERGVPVVGLEPSCLLTLRDEFTVMLPTGLTKNLADNAFLFEEFLAREKEAGRLELSLKPIKQKKALLHGHCHQKAFATMGAVESILALVPGLEVETINSSCCGMAGAFGYRAKTIEISKKMGELSLLPKVREANVNTLIVADGTSCRHQIEDGAKRKAVHVAKVLFSALK